MKQEYKEFRRYVNENFERARDFTQDRLGIELTLIEKLELRKLVEYCQRIYFKDREDFPGEHAKEKSISPWSEASFMFMNNNYGTQIHNLKDETKFALKKLREKRQFGRDVYAESFKRMQNEMHNKFTIY